MATVKQDPLQEEQDKNKPTEAQAPVFKFSTIFYN